MSDRRMSLGTQNKGEELLAAATAGDFSAVSRLLLADADVNYCNQYGYTALTKACRQKRVEVAKLLLDNGAEVNFASKNGWTALIEAARVGSVELVRLLLKREANVEATNKMGWTALIEACRNAHFDAIKVLVEEGHSNVSHRDRDNFTAKDHTSRAHTHMRDYLKKAWRKQEEEAHREGREYGTPTTPTGTEQKMTDVEKMVDAAARGDMEVVKALAAAGVSVNAVNKNGKYSALTLACRNQKKDVVQFLVEKKANINYRSETGWTALIEAARVGNEQLVEYLLSKGAIVNQTNDFGWPPLIEACRNNHYEVVEILVSNGADVALLDCDGETAIEHTNHPWILSLLIDKKYGGAEGGPRARLSNAVRRSVNMPLQEREKLILDTVATLLSTFKEKYEGSLEYALFEVLVQQTEKDLIRAVLRLDDFQAAVLDHKTNILHSMVQLTPPEDDDRKHFDSYREPADRICACMEVILTSLFGNDRKSAFWFVNFQNQVNQGSAMMQAAKNYCDQVEKRAKDGFPKEGLNMNALYYYQIMVCLLKFGSRLNDKDTWSSTVFHYLCLPLSAMKSLAYRNAMDQCINNFKQVWNYYKKRISTDFSIVPEVLNFKDAAGKTPLCYIVMMPEHPEREELVMMLLDRGACFPEGDESKQEQSRLMAMIVECSSDPATSWRVMRNAVRYSDVQMVKRVIARKLPVYMVRPPGVEPFLPVPSQRANTVQKKLGERGTRGDIVKAAAANYVQNDDESPERDTPNSPMRTTTTDSFMDVNAHRNGIHPDVDCANLEECLLHMAIEAESKAIFDELIAYGELPPTTHAPGFPTWPWPNKEVANNLTWQDSFGHNAFHVCANKKQRIPTPINAQFFSKLLKRDIHAVCTRYDNYGWSPLHYASYHNKLSIVNMLIAANIDLEQVTLEENTRYALHLAAERGNWSITLALLKSDVEVDVIDKTGCTPLALAMLARQEVIRAEEAEKGMPPEGLPQSAPRAEEVPALPPFSTTTQSLLGTPPLPESPTEEKGPPVPDFRQIENEERKAQYHVELTPMRTRSDTEITRAATMAEAYALQQEKRKAHEVEILDPNVVDEEDHAAKDNLTTTRKDMYNMTIEALLNHNASIAVASAKSGKSLYDLMNVRERWILLSGELSGLELAQLALEDQYYDALANANITFAQRREKKEEMQRQIQVLDTRRDKLFLDKEAQMVINQYYDEQIRQRHFMKLIRYVVFLGLMTWLGIWTTTRDAYAGYLMNYAMEQVIETNQYFIPGPIPDPPGAVSPLPKSFDQISSDIGDFYGFCSNLLPGEIYFDDPSGSGPNPAPSTWVPEIGEPNNSPHTRSVILRNRVGLHQVIIGLPRLRQIRSQFIDCQVADIFKGISGVCYNAAEDDHNFGPLGKYVWQSESDLEGVPIWGQVFTLSGAGIEVLLPDPRTANTSTMENFCNTLQNDGFLDAGTRALFIEYTLLSAEENFFLSAAMLLEFPRAGGIVSSWDHHVVQLHRYFNDSQDIGRLVLELIVLLMLIMHIYSEVLQMKQSRNCSYLDSIYNWSDLTLVLCGPVITGLEIAGLIVEKDIDWAATDTFVPVARLVRIYYVQRYIYSVVLLVCWLKLFDYLSVFREFYRLVIIIETSASKLTYIFLVFCIILGGFNSAEYIAYGFKDPNSATWVWGFVNRLIGIFAGNPLVTSHWETDRILGITYQILFVLIFSMLLLNLIVAMLTSGYDEALEETSDTIARRQYDKMNSEGLTKEKRVKDADTGKKEKKELTERLDAYFLSFLSTALEKIDDFLDRRVIRILRTRNVKQRKKRRGSKRELITSSSKV